MDKKEIIDFVKSLNVTNRKDAVKEIKDNFKISIPTAYHYWNLYHESANNRDVDKSNITEDKAEIKEDKKQNIDKINVSEDKIESDKSNIIMLDSNPNDSNLSNPSNESDKSNKEDSDKKEQVKTAEIIGIAVDLLDSAYKMVGLEPMDLKEKESGYEYSEAIANKRLNITSEDADIYNLAFWGIKSLGKRIPQIIQKLSKPQMTKNVNKPSEAVNDSNIPNYNNMSVAEIMKSLNK